MVDDVLWWTGVVTWCVMASVGLLLVSDWLLDRVLTSLDLKRAFLRWVWDSERRKADVENS